MKQRSTTTTLGGSKHKIKRIRKMWLAVDKDGSEYTYDKEPVREQTWFEGRSCINAVELPKGTILKILGRELDWLDNPVEYKG